MPANSWMPHLLWTVGFVSACRADSGLPPVDRSIKISYPPGVTGDLPSDTFGAIHPLLVRATDAAAGTPLKGIEVTWDGLAYPPPVQPRSSITNDSGYASAVWRLRPYAGIQSVRGYLPGAVGNPVEYRLLVTAPLPKP